MNDDGEVRPEYRNDYVLAGRPRSASTGPRSAAVTADAQAIEDERRAFANQAPAV